MTLSGHIPGTDGALVKIGSVVATGVTAAVALAVTLVGAGSASAAAVKVTCGATLNGDAYLAKDLRCPAGNGIFFETDVRLDLRGHRLIGPGAATEQSTTKGIGITLSPVWSSTIVNGTIEDWPIAVGGNEDFETVPNATVDGVRFVDNGIAVLANQAQLSVTGSVLRDNTIGISAPGGWESGAVVTVTGTTFRGNGTAFVLGDLGRATLTGNQFRGNGTGFTLAPATTAGYTALLQSNVFRANGDGIRVGLPGTSLGDNTAVHNTGWGIYAPGAVDLGGNTARRNGNLPQCVGVAC